MKTSLLRSRWAAIGAAVAVSLGAGGFGISQATTSSGEMPIYVPIEPCRLADTRPAPNTVGPRSTPLGAAETYTLSGRGTVGDCTLPTGGTGLSLNVTAVGATLPTFLTLFPADSTLPIASHLNPQPGQPPTPNAVNVDLDTSGEFSIYNRFGTVNVIIDVVGYYDDHIHDRNDIRDEPGVASDYDKEGAIVNETDLFVREMASTEIRVPADGYVAIEATGNWRGATIGHDDAVCQLQKGSAAGFSTSGDDPWFWLSEGVTNQAELTAFSAHRVMPIFAADNPPIIANAGQKIMLVCDGEDGSIQASQLHISATYYPTKYEPRTLTTIPGPILP